MIDHASTILERLLRSVFDIALLVNGVHTQLSAKSTSDHCCGSDGTDSASCELKPVHLFQGDTSVFNTLILHETVTLAATRGWIFVKVDKLELAERLKHLLDIAFGQIEVERTDVESGRRAEQL